MRKKPLKDTTAALTYEVIYFRKAGSGITPRFRSPVAPLVPKVGEYCVVTQRFIGAEPATIKGRVCNVRVFTVLEGPTVDANSGTVSVWVFVDESKAKPSLEKLPR